MLKQNSLPDNIIDAFQVISAKYSASIAILQGKREIAYGELDKLSDKLAARLVAAGVKPGSFVGLSGAREIETFAALLAILKAGAAYVPLPEYYSASRVRLIAKEAGLSAIVGSVSALSGTNITQINYDETEKTAASSVSFPSHTSGESAAYVMYTSGTTGRPKGVVVPHRAILRLVCNQDFMELGPQERILQNSPIAFDAATLEIWGALLNGGTLVLPPSKDISLRGLGEVIREQRITTMWLTAGLFHAVADERPQDLCSLHQLLTGGDVVSPAKVAQVMQVCPDLTIINGYGPTENTTFTCCHTVSQDDTKTGEALPIGKPIRGTEIHVLDEALNPVKPGEIGELCASGEGLALGYLGQEELTAEKFVSAPWDKNLKFYRTGDLVRQGKDEVVHYIGRVDTQVKIRGFRVELAGIEAALERYNGIRQAAVIARSSNDQTDKTLIGYYVAGSDFDVSGLHNHIKRELPDYAVPTRLIALDALPLNDNGKIDRKELESRAVTDTLSVKEVQIPKSSDTQSIEDKIAAYLADILGQEDLDRRANFFDLGASSLHIARLHERMQRDLGLTFPISDFFIHSTISALSTHLSQPDKIVQANPEIAKVATGSGSGPIAIVGLAGRFPGAPDIETFWDGLLNGREMISRFSREELDPAFSDVDIDDSFVLARGVMPDPEYFDARHFGIPPNEAERLDPQHRILLEVAQTALENAGHDPKRFNGRIGVFAGSSMNSYLLNNLLSKPGASRKLAAGYPVKDFATLFGNDKDFIATRIAYKLGLQGPAVTVQCACSTSLVAVAQACESLQRGTSDMVLAGGVSITFPSKRPYEYLPDGMASSDGHCRTFDAKATGTVFGDGAAIVVLRRLEDAIKDGDEIFATIRGYSINNDGSDKAGYAAPSMRAQSQVIQAAHTAAGVKASSIGYVEAHGTATPLGDPIEFSALQDAFSVSAGSTGFCALGTAKTNVGHLDIAAGVTGLIKTALTLKNQVIPPLLHYNSPNPQIDFGSSAFYPVTEKTPWPRSETPRRAGVSAFGVGGTNIHMVLEEAPAEEPETKQEITTAPRVFPISASSSEALKAAVSNLGDWAGANPQANPDQVVATLRFGRQEYDQRAILIAGSIQELEKKSAGFSGKGVTAKPRDSIAFLFPGQGAQHAGMARDLFANAPVFREALGLCATLLEPELGLNLLDVIHAPKKQHETVAEQLKDTALAQPAIFSIGYALAKQWGHWGITPDVMVGHSIGEFAAATIAGVFALPDALKLIALRGRLMADLPKGAMISVRAAEDELGPYLDSGLDLAAVNGAKACVLAGPEENAKAVLRELEKENIAASRLHTSHAFHSRMMDPALDPFRKAVSDLTINKPKIPILSTVTGDWLTDSEATDPDYWAMHMRRPVRFYDALQLLWTEGRHIFIETGPGRTMATLASQSPSRKNAQPAIASLPAAQADRANSHISMLEAFGALWANGYPVDWSRIDDNRPKAKRATGLPTYPFQRKRYWVEPVKFDASPAALDASADDASKIEADAEFDHSISAGDALREMLSELSGIEPEEMDGDASFLELGFDSLLLTQATRELSERFGVKVALRQLIDGFPDIDALAAYIEEHGNLKGTIPIDKPDPAEMLRLETVNDSEKSSAPVIKIESGEEEISPVQREHIDRLIKRFNAKTAKSKELTAKYRPVHADPRTASGFNRLWKEIVYQIVTVKSKGSRLIDIDGNEYIDILNGFGPGFLGHSPDFLVEAIENQLEQGFEVGPQSLAAMESAELFCEVTGNERASFVCTGSEAVYAAMRLARTVTNRDRIVMFARDYHGNFDEVLVRGVESKDGTRTMPLAPGIPRDSIKNIVVLPYGSPQALDYIRRNADSLAAVVVEPVQSRRPEFRPAEFIREVRQITEKSGTLFIFDEVVTGFRFGPRGAQAYYNVDADLITYGKVVGGGMPIGIVSGKARYMDTFDGGQWQYGDNSFPKAPVTFFAGTFVRHPLAMASLREMLLFFRSQPDFFWKTVNAKGDKLAGTIDRWFEDNDMPFQMPNCGSLMYLRIGEDQKFGGLIGSHMRDRGVFLLEGFPSYMTAAHDDEDIEHVINAFKDSALEMQSAGLLAGRDTIAYEKPLIEAAPPRLSLPDGEKVIAKAMAEPLKPLAVPTTEGQREIWGAMILTPEVSAAYNESVTLEMSGEIDADLLMKACDLCFNRHDALRATFSPDGKEMLISPVCKASTEFIDFSDMDAAKRDDRLKALLRSQVETPFDMENGPFINATLARLKADIHHLIITAHHIVCDGWSIDVIMRDIGRIYTALLEGKTINFEPPDSIIDYALAEEKWKRSEAAAADRDYFLKQFEGELPVLDLPIDRPRPPVRTVAAARYDAVFDPDFVAKLRSSAAAQGTTLVNLLLAAFNLYLARISNSQDIVVGVPASGQASRGMSSLVGHCVNLMPIRSKINPSETFSSFLKETQTRILDASEHQHFGFGALVRALKLNLNPARVPLTPVIFNIDNGIDLSDMRFGNVKTNFVSNPRTSENFEIFLNLTDTKKTITAEWTYNTDLFDRDTIENHNHSFTQFLQVLIEHPTQPVGILPLISDKEKAEILKLGQGRETAYPDDTTLPQLFAAQVARTPNSPAIIYMGKEVTYETLDRMANAISHRLVAQGITKGDIVGICLERSAPMVATMLAVMKLGAAYLPLDPGHPSDRLSYIVKDSCANIVVLDADVSAQFGDIKTLSIDALTEEEISTADPVEIVKNSPLSAAYIIYTSGSTGQPKGVIGTHRATINRFAWMWRAFPFKPDEVMCQKTSISFGDSIWEIFGPLLAGIPQVIIPSETARDPAVFLTELKLYNVTRLLVVPSMLKALVNTVTDLQLAVPSLRFIFSSGESLSAALARQTKRAAPEIILVNLYGSSEVAADVTCEVVNQIDTDEVPIGRPIDNARLYVLDQSGQISPYGITGELFVGGEALAKGYLHQPDLTAERFVPDPFSNIPGAKMFATGDLASLLPDGRFMYHGRSDHQVKIRGARVELGEVEAAINGLPMIAEAIVSTSEDNEGDKQLIAFVTRHETSVIDPKIIRQRLLQILPDYMVPTQIHVLNKMPLNPNGKTDRKALMEMPREYTQEAVPNEKPQTHQEKVLHQIWTQLLGTDKIGLDDDYFTLGGHSLMAVKLFSRIKRKFGVDLPISTLLAYPTIRSLAKQLDQPVSAIVHTGSPEDSPWDTVAVIHPGPDNSAQPLFIVGGVGGNVNNLFEVGQALGKFRPLIGLQTRGVLGHKMHDSIEAAAADHIENIKAHKPNGPYLLAGYSGGAFTAYEMARQLKEQGEEVQFLGIIDMEAPGFSVDLNMSKFDRLKFELDIIKSQGPGRFFNRLRARLRGALVPNSLVRLVAKYRPESFRLKRLRDHWLRVSKKYKPGPFDGDAWLFVTEADGYVAMMMKQADPYYGWRDLIRGTLRTDSYPTNHLDVLKGEAAVKLAERIESEIQRSIKDQAEPC